MNESLFFDTVKEHRGEYFIEYQPPVTGVRFATLSLVFPNAVESSRVASLMELELRRGLSRYPVPLMVSAFDGVEDLIRVRGGGENCHLVGWIVPGTGEVTHSWKLNDLTEFLETAPPKADWRAIYTDVPFRTDAQVKVDAEKDVLERRRQNLALKVIFALWLAAIPAGIAVFEYFGPEWLSLIALLFSLWQAYRVARKIWGHAKPSVAEAENSEKNRKMAHYYYHCERNPNGFARLKAENFASEISKRIRDEAAELAEGSTGPRKDA